MPNQYKNKVIYGDSVLMDITDTTAEAGDVASGAVFYAKNGARTVGTFTQAQSDWNETDTTDPSYILNKPTIDRSLDENSSNAVRNSEITAELNKRQGKAIYGSTNTSDSNYISPFLASVCIVDDHLDLVISHNTNAYGQLFFSSWNVATTANLIVSNVILYNYGLLCATLVGYTSLDTNTWVFTVYPIQDALTFDSTPTHGSTNPVTSGGVYTALSGKANNADIPSASSSTPLADGTAAVGTSTAYARADHVHPKIPIDSALSTTSENPVQNKVIRNALVNKLDVNTNYNPILLDFPDPENPPSILDGATIICGMDFDFILEKYQLAIDTTFELMSESQNYNVIVFHPFRIDENGRSIELFSIFKRNIYTLTLEPNTDLSNPYSMVGTLHVDAIDVKPAFFGGQWINYGLGAANPQYGSHVLLTNYYIDGTLYNTSLLLYAVPDYEISNISSPLISLYKGYTESGIAITYEKDNSSPYNIWNWDAGEHSISVNQAYVYMPNTIPSASSTRPVRDGTAAVGTSTNYARADHVHPKITQTISMSNNVITLTGSDGSTSSVTLPVYDGTVTSGGGS